MGKESFGKKIHIIPLGHEIDRAIKPFETHKADRAHILAVTKRFDQYQQSMIEEQMYYVNCVKRALENYGIEVKTQEVDLFNSLEVAKHISRSIINEKGQGNQVLVNISSGNKLSSGIAAITAMAHNVEAYYVVADNYSSNNEEKRKHGISICSGQLQLRWINNLPVQLPKDSALRVLVLLSQAKRELKTTEILQHLGKQKVPGFEGYDNTKSKLARSKKINFLMKLNKSILTSLQTEGYISRKQSGKYNLIEITQKGMFAAHISGQI